MRVTNDCFILGKNYGTTAAAPAGETSLDEELLKILCCPETHQSLSPAASSLLEKMNRQIAARQLRNRGGDEVLDALDGGLLRADGKYLYPVRGNIPVMLVEESIPLAI